MTHFPFIGRALAPAALACSLLCLAPAALAQDAVKRRATRIVNLQKAQDMDALIAQLAGSANKVIDTATGCPDSTNFLAKQKAAADQLDSELKKFNDDNVRTIKAKNDKLSLEVLVPAYAEKFSTEELKQLVAFLESATIKKYYAANPQLANLLAQRLVDHAGRCRGAYQNFRPQSRANRERAHAPLSAKQTDAKKALKPVLFVFSASPTSVACLF